MSPYFYMRTHVNKIERMYEKPHVHVKVKLGYASVTSLTFTRNLPNIRES